ncbi:hypothetical protein [Nocardia gipuzkoensis]
MRTPRSVEDVRPQQILAGQGPEGIRVGFELHHPFAHLRRDRTARTFFTKTTKFLTRLFELLVLAQADDDFNDTVWSDDHTVRVAGRQGTRGGHHPIIGDMPRRPAGAHHSSG